MTEFKIYQLHKSEIKKIVALFLGRDEDTFELVNIHRTASMSYGDIKLKITIKDVKVSS
jgi:hypothetical protein